MAQLQSVPLKPAIETHPPILDQVQRDGLENTDDAAPANARPEAGAKQPAAIARDSRHEVGIEKPADAAQLEPWYVRLRAL